MDCPLLPHPNRGERPCRRFDVEGLASDIGRPLGTPGSVAITLSQNYATPDDVDAAYASALAAGAEAVKAPERAFWGGYSGCVADPDGHLWELAHNPDWPVADDGSITIAGGADEGGEIGPTVRQVAGAKISHAICSSLPAGKSGQVVGMIAEYRNHVALSIQVSMMKYQWLVLPKADILEWGVLDKGSIPSRVSDNQGGALVGALVFGPIGAFFGAASDKAAAAKENAKPVIGITFQDGDAEGAIFLEFPMASFFRKANDFLADVLPAQQRE